MFKVGDWIRNKYTGTIAKVATSDYKNRKVLIYYKSTEYVKQKTEENYELWKPQEGEWCWFRTEACQYPELRQFECMHTFKTRETVYMSMDTEYYEYCQPFIGELPTFLKDN